MLPQSTPRKRRNSSRVNLAISFTFHGLIILALVFFAAREGLLGTELRKIAVEMVKEKPPEKPKEPKPELEPEPIIEEPTPAPVVAQPTEAPPREVVAEAPPPSGIAAPPAVAPAIAQLPSFHFEGGKAVQSSSDPVQIYRQLVEYTLRSHWNRPTDLEDRYFVAEVEVGVDSSGRIQESVWKRGSGNARWDDSVRQSVARTTSISRPPPAEFPSRVLVRFDVVDEVPEPLLPAP